MPAAHCCLVLWSTRRLSQCGICFWWSGQRFSRCVESHGSAAYDEFCAEFHEAAGRVIARNGIVYGTEAVTGVLATLASLNPALGAALGVAAGAGAGVAADKSGLTDWAGRTLAPIL